MGSEVRAPGWQRRLVIMNSCAPILIAEDDDADVFLLRRALERAAIPNPLVHVPDGRQAVRYLGGEAGAAGLANQPPPALILLDLKMPVLDGFGLLAWLREQANLKQVPAVVLTGSATEADRNRSTQLGARDYLLKPTFTDQFIPLVQQIRERWLESPKACPDAAAGNSTAQGQNARLSGSGSPANASPSNNMPMNSASNRVSFRELGIASFGCQPETFEKMLFRRTLYLHARILSWILPKTAFAPDWLLIRDVATARTLQEIVLAVNDHRYIHPEDETTMHALKIRISGRKLIRVAREIFSKSKGGGEAAEETDARKPEGKG